MPQKVVFVTLNNSPASGNYGVLELPELVRYLNEGYVVKDFKQMSMPASTKLSGAWIDVIFVLEK